MTFIFTFMNAGLPWWLVKCLLEGRARMNGVCVCQSVVNMFTIFDKRSLYGGNKIHVLLDHETTVVMHGTTRKQLNIAQSFQTLLVLQRGLRVTAGLERRWGLDLSLNSIKAPLLICGNFFLEKEKKKWVSTIKEGGREGGKEGR